MTIATDYERYMLSLVNAERALGGLSFLELEQNLNLSSDGHSQWMLDEDVFSHTGESGSTATNRMVSAGMDFSGSWRSAENLAVVNTVGSDSYYDEVDRLHENLMNSPGHRANILDPNLNYVGIGIAFGNASEIFGGGAVHDSVIVTQNFVATDGDVDLDLRGTNSSDLMVGQTGDDYIVSLKGSDTLRAGAGADVAISGAGADHVSGQGGADTLFGGYGDDTLVGGSGRDSLGGGSGQDVLRGNWGADTLSGGSQDDKLFGGSGRDRLNGNSGRDDLFGGRGNDLLYGHDGNDQLEGGDGADRIWGGSGHDVINGGAGNDQMRGNGGNDVFVFSTGNDVIHDFNATDDNEDVDLRHIGSITDFNDLITNHTSTVGSGVLIEDQNGNSLLLAGVSISDLDVDDFVF